MKTLAEHLGVAPLKAEQPAPEELTFDESMSDADFCRGVLMSRVYRESLQRRLLLDELPPAVELMMWDRAYGTRKERVEVEHKERPLQDWNDEQVAERELFLLRLLRKLRTNGTGTSTEEGDERPPSVH